MDAIQTERIRTVLRKEMTPLAKNLVILFMTAKPERNGWIEISMDILAPILGTHRKEIETALAEAVDRQLLERDMDRPLRRYGNKGPMNKRGYKLLI